MQKKDVVKYRNEFNITCLNCLDKIEQDILFTFCSTLSREKKMEARMTFGELRQKAFLTDRNVSWETSFKKLVSLSEKLTNLKFVYTDGLRFGTMPLFSSFFGEITDADEWHDEDYIGVKLNPEFARYFFDIPEKIGFSRFELTTFIFLRSKYSKTLFRHLLQRFQGKWVVKFSDLRQILGFPPSYGTSMILSKIQSLLPELEETGYFSNIEIDWTTKNAQGRPIKDVIFTYEVNQSKAAEAAGQTTIMDYDYATENKTVKTIDTTDPLRPIMTEEVVREIKKCPKCGGNLITRTASNGDNAGRRYEKCEKNDGSLLPADRACTYFNWLD